jgi:hypothetical protein
VALAGPLNAGRVVRRGITIELNVETENSSVKPILARRITLKVRELYIRIASGQEGSK